MRVIQLCAFRRDKSEPPPSAIPEVDEKGEDVSTVLDSEPPIVHHQHSAGELSPKRRLLPRECEALSDVQAYTMLKEEDGSAGIQS